MVVDDDDGDDGVFCMTGCSLVILSLLVACASVLFTVVGDSGGISYAYRNPAVVVRILSVSEGTFCKIIILI